MKYNEIIRRLREDKDLTQSELGKIFNVSQITISQYERGTRALNIEMLILYAKYFNVSADYILELSDDPTPRKPSTKIKNNININFGNVNMN